ncbi:MAG: A/G-specific adenine glycosylase [Frankiaceae bacterium]|nr:A/G-specific adenine glycosylase [Frankiaceae bacterium]
MRETLLDWYAGAARDLPWRRPAAGPWGVLVSEFMLQQTPVARVLPVWEMWVSRWPSPAALAGDSAGEAIRAWGRLGYPRRAQRLHAAAGEIVARFGGEVPSSYDDLRSLPGVGGYTARAVRAFGFGASDVPLDTNVRRVLARLHQATADATGSAPGRAEQDRADDFADGSGGVGAALMELGAVICVARTPRCTACPAAAGCGWRAAGFPPGVAKVGQSYAGTDRQARGALLAVLRATDGAVPPAELARAWVPEEQRERALAGLLADGLAIGDAERGYALPS